MVLAIEHARLADGEVGDVDHFLHLAVALGLDLAHLQADQAAERVLVPAQRLGAQAHGLAAVGRRHGAPQVEGLARGATISSYSSSEAVRTVAMGSPVAGLIDSITGPSPAARASRPRRRNCRRRGRGCSESSCISCSLARWCPTSPVAIMRADTSFVPPCA
jgi:hypothetical protein